MNTGQCNIIRSQRYDFIGHKGVVNHTIMSKDSKKAIFSRGIEDAMGSLYSVALRLTRNPADAEDLVAESVTKAWSAFDSLEDHERFRPWVFRILHNCFVSDYRKKSVRPDETSYDELPSNSGDDEIVELIIQQSNEFMHWWANPEKEFINQLLREDILRAIENLPQVFRTTIMLVNVEGMSYDEAAEVMEVPPGTVHSRMKRGRTLLQKALWELAIDEGLIVDNQLQRIER